MVLLIIVNLKQGTKKFQSPKTAQQICEQIKAGSLVRVSDHLSFIGEDEVPAGVYDAEYNQGFSF
jgi:hypothetical protein